MLLSDKAAQDARICGGKAATLARLFEQFDVPRGFIVLPHDLNDTSVLEIFDTLGLRRVAVRSSAVNEDGKDTAWAGQLESYLNIEKEDLTAAITKCRYSSSSERAKSYATAHNTVVGDVAVIVQEMIPARVSGVAFTKHPVTGADEVVIEAVSGLGEKLVGGHTTPDTYIEGRETHLAGQKPVLSREELSEVIQLAKDITQSLGYDVDIEWAFGESTVYLLQARPITTV